MHLRRLFPIGLVLTLASCGDGVVGLGDLDERKALDAAPLTLELDGATYRARGSAWRDGMPGGQPGLRMTGIVVASPTPVAPDVEVDKLFLVRGDEAWVSAPDVAKNDYGEASGLAEDGPPWSAGSRVSLYVRFTRGARVFYLRTPVAEIEAVQ